jgi:excisionase family DNA binding protein
VYDVNLIVPQSSYDYARDMGDGETDMFTVTQAAERLGLHRTTLLRQITRGILHAKRLGSVWVISAAEVERYRHTHQGKVGVSSPDHPLHGKRGGGGRRKKDDPTPH